MKKIKWIFIGLIFVIAIACSENQTSNKQPAPHSDEQLIERGKAITQATFQALSQELQKSMMEGGVEKAITYCNVNALPITEKLSKQHNAIIKRTSLKYRNSINAPTKAEVDILRAYQAEIDAGDALKPKLTKENDQSIFYAPIIMQDQCLKCHGAKQSISAYDQILSKYPGDLATEYLAGDLRGMWSVALLPSKNK